MCVTRSYVCIVYKAYMSEACGMIGFLTADQFQGSLVLTLSRDETNVKLGFSLYKPYVL